MRDEEKKKRIAVRSRRALGLCALLLLGCSGRPGTGGAGSGEGSEEALSDREDPKKDWEQAPSSYEDPGGDSEGGDPGVLIYPDQCSGAYYCDDDFTILALSEGRCLMSIAGFGSELLPNHTWTFADIVVGTWYLSPPGFTICNSDQECSPCEPL